jgi:hypothetical protein
VEVIFDGVARDSGPMFEVPDTYSSIDVVTGIPSKRTFAQCQRKAAHWM